jgi:NADH dehydrogenase/NADH:ubiquinone oxidoreductase subunit G
MDPSLLDPWTRLIRIEVLGKHLEVPEGNVLLRQLQYISEDIGMGRYCWNGECRYCEVKYKTGDGPEQTAFSCLIKGTEGMRLTKLTPDVKYNLSEALATAPAVE